MEESSLIDSLSATSASSDPNFGWQKVTYPKRHRKQAASADPSTSGHQGAKSASSDNVFATVEQKANERHRAIQSMKAASLQPPPLPRGAGSDEDEDDDDAPRAQENGGEAAPKKPKQKKPKKPKVTVAEAAAAIDVNDLSAFIAEISVSYEDRQDIQLMRFADYFGRAFASVSASQFPWFKMFKESPVAKTLDVPLNHIPEPVYRAATDWVAQKSPEALGEFLMWCMDIILADLASHVAVAKGSKKAPGQPSTRSQVAMFAVLAMTLRRKPETLISILPKIKDNPKYQGQEKLPFIVWAIGQASLGDLAVGTYLWARYLFPTVCGKLNGNPQSRDLVLQLIERALSSPKSKSILSNSAVRKGERLVPPSSFDLLMRATFPPPPSRVKATERFEAVYPILKEVALAGTPGSKTTKQASYQLLPCCIKAMQENNPELTKEASGVFFWCLTQNTECYKQWDEHHMGNLDASVVVLRKLVAEWKELSLKLSPDALREAVANMKTKTEEALDETTDPAKLAALKEADKLCKAILGKLSHGIGCLKGGVVVVLLATVVAGLAMSPNVDSFDWEKIRAMFTSTQSF